MPMSKILLSIVFLQLLIGFCRADSQLVRVTLDNGDSLSGDLVSESESELKLVVDYLGEVTLDRLFVVEVVKQETDFPEQAVAKLTPEIVTEEKPVLAEANKKAIESENVAATPKSPAAPTEEPQEVAEAGSPPRVFSKLWIALGYVEDGLNFLPQWDKRLQLGLNSSSGRKEQTTANYRLDMDRKRESTRTSIKAEYAYGKANEIKNRDRFSSTYTWRKDIAPGVFYESKTDFYSDVIKLIDSNLEQKLGLGTRMLSNETSSVSAGLGAIGRWREFSDEEEDTDVDYLVNVFQDWDYEMSERIRLEQDFRFAMPLEESDDYEINFSAAVTSAVTEAINLSIRYEFGYDNSLSSELREDRRFISSLGYAF